MGTYRIITIYTYSYNVNINTLKVSTTLANDGWHKLQRLYISMAAEYSVEDNNSTF